MSVAALLLAVCGYPIVAIITGFARQNDIPNEDAGAVAAGVLWPIYLPYRLALIMWSKSK